jgi:hypothetical protein
MGNMGAYGKLIGKQWENNGKYDDISGGYLRNCEEMVDK